MSDLMIIELRRQVRALTQRVADLEAKDPGQVIRRILAGEDIRVHPVRPMQRVLPDPTLDVLEAIGAGGATASEIARIMKRKPSNVSPWLSKLWYRGAVVRFGAMRPARYAHRKFYPEAWGDVDETTSDTQARGMHGPSSASPRATKAGAR